MAAHHDRTTMTVITNNTFDYKSQYTARENDQNIDLNILFRKMLQCGHVISCTFLPPDFILIGLNVN